MINADNFIGWPMLTKYNTGRYYPDTFDTPKGHLNQIKNNVRLMKLKLMPFEIVNQKAMHGKKISDIYTKFYNVRESFSPNRKVAHIVQLG